MEIDLQRHSGLNQDAVNEFKKRKADFFSKNIINLEKKDYSAISRARKNQPAQILEMPTDLLSNLLSDLPKSIVLPAQGTIEEAIKYSHLRRYFVNEAYHLNDLLSRVREDLATFCRLKNGSFTEERPLLADLTQLSLGKIPQAWACQSGKSLPLMPWLNRLRASAEFLGGLVEDLSKSVYFFDIRLFSNPSGLIDSYLLDATYRRAPSMKFDDITVSYRMTNSMPPNSARLAEDCIYLSGLKVRNAFVDRSKGELSDRYEGATCGEDVPYVSVTCRSSKKVNEKNEGKTFLCPVLDRRSGEVKEIFRMVGEFYC